MSDQTKRTIDDAICAHVSDETGKRVVAWVLVAAAIDPETYADGGAHYWREQSDGQQLHVTEGLLRVGIRMVRDSWNNEGDA